MKDQRCHRIDALFRDCLFVDGEDTSTAVKATGITSNFGFHPARLAASLPELTQLARDTVSDAFLASGGGGMSFLQLAFDRHDVHWAEHQTLQQLVVLCVAGGLAGYCLPKEMWGALPGGMPYVVFNL